jgi:hypothetical protein
MSFAQNDLHAIGGSADGKVTWEYTTDNTPSEVANEANYFGWASSLLSVGDTLFIKSGQPLGISAVITQSDGNQVQLGSVAEITI